jgi:hypothetical protein
MAALTTRHRPALGNRRTRVPQQRALATPAAARSALGVRREQRATLRHYIDDCRYVVSAVDVSGRAPMFLRPPLATMPPGGIARKED